MSASEKFNDNSIMMHPIIVAPRIKLPVVVIHSTSIPCMMQQYFYYILMYLPYIDDVTPIYQKIDIQIR